MSLDAATRAAEEKVPLRRWILAFLGIALVCGLLYGRTLSFQFTNCDDTTQITRDAEFLRNPGNVIKAFNRPDFKQEVGSGPSEYYRPLVTISYMIDAFPSGNSQSRYHLGNLIYHILASWLVVLFLVRLGHEFHLAAVLGLIFSIHPGLTEAVAWIPGRTDILLGIAFLLSFLCYLRYERTDKKAWLLGHAIAYFSGLLTKETALVIPLVILAYNLMVSRDRKKILNPILWIAWIIVSVFWFYLWKKYSIKAKDISNIYQLKDLISNVPALFMYLGKIVWPWHLSGLAVIKNTPWLPGLLAAIAFGFGWPWLKMKNPSRYAWGLFAFFIFIAITLPVSDFLILEPRLYAPLMCILVALAEVARPDGIRSHFAVRKSVTGAALLFGCTVLAGRSYIYSSDFRNEEIFAASAVANSPDSSSAHLARGIWLQNNNQLDLAIQHYVQGIRILPSQPLCHNNLGVIFMRMGDLTTAEKFFHKEIAINPNYDVVHYNLGIVYKSLGRKEEAIKAWKEVIRINPFHKKAAAELANQ